MSQPILLTQAETDFIHHHRYESLNLARGPAGGWLLAHDISASRMIPFLYVDQESNDRWLERVLGDPLPPFRPAWSSKEEFEARAARIVEAYPVLKGLPSALPGFRPGHSNDAPSLVGSR